MTTRKLLEDYCILEKQGNGAALQEFVDANRNNKRFVSLIDLKTSFMSGLKNG